MFSELLTQVLMSYRDTLASHEFDVTPYAGWFSGVFSAYTPKFTGPIAENVLDLLWEIVFGGANALI